MAMIGNYEVTLRCEDSKIKNVYKDFKTATKNFIIFEPGASVEIKSYTFIYRGSDYESFKNYIIDAIKNKDILTLKINNASFDIVIISASFKKQAGEVNTLRGVMKVIALNGYVCM